MLKIITITSSRAEYDLLFPLLDLMKKSKKIQNKIIACGSHLDSRFGKTTQQIKKDNFKNIESIKTLSLNFDNSNFDTLNSFKIFFSKFSFFLKNKKIDLVLALGDRYEMFGASICCYFLNIPIVHISGGDTSLGSKDEIFRNSISQMSDLHFVKINQHKKKLINLGINAKDIIVTGSLSNDNYKKKFDKKFFLKKPFILITFHSVTNSKDENDSNIKYLLSSLKKYKKYNMLFTSSNHDTGGKKINSLIKKFVKLNKNSIFVHNLGRDLYYHAMHDCEFMIGNSSSGIIESMIYKKPAINILPRQLGRHSNGNVINCNNNLNDICKSIDKAISNDFKKKCNKLKNFFKKNNIKPSKIMLKQILKRYA